MKENQRTTKGAAVVGVVLLVIGGVVPGLAQPPTPTNTPVPPTPTNTPVPSLSPTPTETPPTPSPTMGQPTGSPTATATPTTPPSAPEIPTLSGYGAAILGLLFLGAAAALLRRSHGGEESDETAE